MKYNYKEIEYLHDRVLHLTSAVSDLINRLDEREDMEYPMPVFKKQLHSINDQLGDLPSVSKHQLVNSNLNRLNDIFSSVKGFPQAYKVFDDKPLFNN